MGVRLRYRAKDGAEPLGRCVLGNFVLNYAENDSVLDLSFDGLEEMEYLDVKDYLEMQANKLRNYLPGYSSESKAVSGQREMRKLCFPVPENQQFY